MLVKREHCSIGKSKPRLSRHRPIICGTKSTLGITSLLTTQLFSTCLRSAKGLEAEDLYKVTENPNPTPSYRYGKWEKFLGAARLDQRPHVGGRGVLHTRSPNEDILSLKARELYDLSQTHSDTAHPKR